MPPSIDKALDEFVEQAVEQCFGNHPDKKLRTLWRMNFKRHLEAGHRHSLEDDADIVYAADFNENQS